MQSRIHKKRHNYLSQMSRSNPLAVESLFNNNRMTEIPPYKLMCGLKMPKMNNMAQKADSY